MKLNNLLKCHTFYRKKERIDEQEISLLSSILFVKHMTTFTFNHNKKHSHHNSMISQ